MSHQDPDALFREWNESSNAASREICKARIAVEHALRAVEDGRTRAAKSSLEAARQRLDRAQARLHPRLLTQWRQTTLVPRILRRQRSSGPPDDLVCKKCGEQRDREDFHWHDGHQEGYTLRCRHCRRSGRKQERAAA